MYVGLRNQFPLRQDQEHKLSVLPPPDNNELVRCHEAPSVAATSSGGVTAAPHVMRRSPAGRPIRHDHGRLALEAGNFSGNSSAIRVNDSLLSTSEIKTRIIGSVRSVTPSHTSKLRATAHVIRLAGQLNRLIFASHHYLQTIRLTFGDLVDQLTGH